MLHVLANKLSAMGERVSLLENKPQSLHRQCDEQMHNMTPHMTRKATTVVVVLPELWKVRCVGPRFLHVHWILSPIGGLGAVQGMFSTIFRQNDLIFNYGILSPGTAVPVPTSNLLQVLLNPEASDLFQIKKHLPLKRKGAVFSYRKAKVFHENITIMHPASSTEIIKGKTSMNATIEAFLTHKFFICYDPYSFLAWIAPMLGCATIIHPLNNMTKREWLMSTMYAGYLEHSGVQDMAGIAYGWVEASYALRTKHKVRDELFQMKHYAHSVTLLRFVRDAKRAAAGRLGLPHDGFEGAMQVSDFYPQGWQAMMMHQYKGKVPFMKRRYNKMTSRGKLGGN